MLDKNNANLVVASDKKIPKSTAVKANRVGSKQIPNQQLLKKNGGDKKKPESFSKKATAASLKTALKTNTAKKPDKIDEAVILEAKILKPPASLSAPAHAETLPLPNFETLAHNLSKLVEEGGKALAAYIKPIEKGERGPEVADEVAIAVNAIGKVAEYWLADPQRAIHAQSQFTVGMVDLWSKALKKMTGQDDNMPEELETKSAAPPPQANDKRYSDPLWHDVPFFDFLRRAHDHTSQWAQELVHTSENIDPPTRDLARFYVKQITAALAPANFIATNPQLMRETLKESGENLVRGMKMLAEDIEAGHGTPIIRHTDRTKFKVGENVANTPGKVVFRNELIELIQYTPTTPDVTKRPLLIVPPWINKFYILDLNPEKSFIRYCVAQGLTVFVISWVNPDERHKNMGFEEYMRLGLFAALDAVALATGEPDVSAIGYCVGGTLLATALAYMAELKDTRIANATFFAAQVDFVEAGDLLIFMDETQLKVIEEDMTRHGYLDGTRMANTFNMMRPDELIWPYIVNNYVLGKEPQPFDLLAWNADITRMPAANHAYYLRNFYLDNALVKGALEFCGKKLDLKKVKIPLYELAMREDHIAPARSVFRGAKSFGSSITFVLAGSGHIAGVINPESRAKYNYAIGPDPHMVKDELDAWEAKSEIKPGSWWPHWISWMREVNPGTVPARHPGDGQLKVLCDAPGTYVHAQD